MTRPTPPIEQQPPTTTTSTASEEASVQQQEETGGGGEEERPVIRKCNLHPPHHHHVHLPRIEIKYCTQCRWMLRAAYFAQELLSTFGATLGEVVLVPMTGGVFTITVAAAGTASRDDAGADADADADAGAGPEAVVIWDRKRDGGFPEVKQLKSLVRNIVDPGRSLGHTDRALAMKKMEENGEETEKAKTEEKEDHRVKHVQGGAKREVGGKENCEDCQ